MKYAVIKIGGQQFKVEEGETISVNKIEGQAKDKLKLDQVLLVVDGKKVVLGQPIIKTAVVSAEIVEQKKDKKIRVAKYKAKSKYRKVQGHRQLITCVKIVKITI